MLSAFTISSHCLLSTLATESRTKPVVSESPHRNINAAESMAVWKSGTSPVAKSSIMMGMPKASPVQHSHYTGHSVCFWWLANAPLSLRLRGLHAQLVADELEGGGDGLVHVVVLVAA